MTIKAHVRAGRLLVDEPTELPEGAENLAVEVEEALRVLAFLPGAGTA